MQPLDPRDVAQFPLTLTVQGVVLRGQMPLLNMSKRRPARGQTPEEQLAWWLVNEGLGCTQKLMQQEDA